MGFAFPPFMINICNRFFPAGQWFLSLSRSRNLGANARSGQINKAAVPSWAAPLIPGPGLLHTRALRSLPGRPMSLSADRCFKLGLKRKVDAERNNTRELYSLWLIFLSTHFHIFFFSSPHLNPICPAFPTDNFRHLQPESWKRNKTMIMNCLCISPIWSLWACV